MERRLAFSLEPLEVRRLLAGIAALDSRGVFDVKSISITLSSDGTSVQAKLGDILLAEADVSDVRLVRVRTAGGDDAVSVDVITSTAATSRGRFSPAKLFSTRAIR
jgi:hypothetical protein